MGNREPGYRDTSSSSHEWPMESRAKVEPVWSRHSVKTHFPKDPNWDICLKSKTTRAPCRRRTGTVVPRVEHFGDLITPDHKVLSERSESRNNHRYPVVVQDLETHWLQSYPCKTKTSQETKKSQLKLYALTVPWNSASPVRNYPGIIVRQHRTDRKRLGLLREQCAEWKKGHPRYFCNQVWTMNGGRIPWNVTALRNIQDLLSDGKTPHERRFGMPFDGPFILFGAMVEYHPICAKDLSRLHQFGAEVLPSFIPWICIEPRVEFGKETFQFQTPKNWSRCTHQKSTPEGSMQRKC